MEGRDLLTEARAFVDGPECTTASSNRASEKQF